MNRLPSLFLPWIAAAVLLSFGCGAEQPAEIPKETPIATAPSALAGPAGRIRGVVRLRGNPPAPAVEPITENQSVCGNSVSLPRLALGAGNGVRRAFVYLDNAPRVQDLRPQQTVLIDQKDCQYVPHALAAPVGTKLEVTNSDPILHNVHGSETTAEGGLQTLFNIAQPVRGQRTTVEPALSKPGIVALSCEAGHPWMSAYIFVADHPYVTVTNDNGEFVIDHVPVGTYRIKMWHEGVTLKRNIKTLQRFEYEEPYEITMEVVVESGAEAVVNFDLSLRPKP